MHWRPLLTMGVIGILISFGIALRYLAPDRYSPPQPVSIQAVATPVCDDPCWHGEACQAGQCTWQKPNNVNHITPQLQVAGPFALGPDVVDVLPLDGDRFAASSLRGVQIHHARTGEVLSLIADAPLAQQLYRVKDVIYAAAPQRIYVIDVRTARVLKSIEIGSQVEDLALGASGRCALASVPGARSVAVLSTEYHSEINRFFFGDDQVGPVAVDDTGKRGLTTTGRAPLPGVRPGRGAAGFGAMYAFDPSRFPSLQDRVRSGMPGNPADIMMVPDAKSSYVVLRAADAVLPLEHLPWGAVRQGKRLHTCPRPDQIELIRWGRRALVRCGEGRALDVFGLRSHRLLRRISLDAQPTDAVITPDGRQAIVTLAADGRGAVVLLDLESYELTRHELEHELHSVHLAPDGRSAVLLSRRSKAAWVIR